MRACAILIQPRWVKAAEGYNEVGAQKAEKITNSRYRFCHWLFYAAVVSGFCLVIWKAAELQILQHTTWAERSRAQVQTTLKVPSYRGSIYDSRGRLLSYSVPQPSLYADAQYVEDPLRLARSLSGILGEPEKGLAAKLGAQRRFIWLKRHMTDEDAMRVEALGARGLGFMREYKRFYPYRQLGGQVLGFVGLDGEGLEGLEKSHDAFLRKDHRVFSQLRDGGRKNLWHGAEPPPKPREAWGLQLSLDAFLQYVAEQELEKAALKYKAAAGQVVVLNPSTFEVYAMANWPPFDPNLPGRTSASHWRNRAITDAFEPGSTFKVFLMGAALEERVLSLSDRIFCENGRGRIAGHYIRDVRPHGWLTVPEVIKYSSNIAASKIALDLGRERYGSYIRSFGFGSPTNIELPGEIKGLVRPENKWRPIDLATTGFGQSIGVTALQLTVGIATIANGGEFREPVVVRRHVSPEGGVFRFRDSKPPRRVLSARTAQEVTQMMRMVTEEGGTGVNAVPEGYTVAGKTGTAQMVDPQTGRYASDRHISSFTGFVPAENPRLVITVVIQEPQGAIYGGTVAAPVFREFAAKALPYLGVMPSGHEQLPASGFRWASTDAVRQGDDGQKLYSKDSVAGGGGSWGRTRISRPMPTVVYSYKRDGALWGE